MITYLANLSLLVEKIPKSSLLVEKIPKIMEFHWQVLIHIIIRKTIKWRPNENKNKYSRTTYAMKGFLRAASTCATSHALAGRIGASVRFVRYRVTCRATVRTRDDPNLLAWHTLPSAVLTIPMRHMSKLENSSKNCYVITFGGILLLFSCWVNWNSFYYSH